MYMIDANIFIDFLRGNTPLIYERFQNSNASQFLVSSIVEAELLLGASKSENPEIERRRVEEILRPFEIVPFDDACAYQYARIRSNLEKQGTPIGSNDYLIAACALANSCILVTNNVKEFKRIKELTIETWAEIDFP